MTPTLRAILAALNRNHRKAAMPKFDSIEFHDDGSAARQRPIVKAIAELTEQFRRVADTLAPLAAALTPAAAPTAPADRAAIIPLAADGLPPGALDSAADGASALDAWARDPHGRNFLAHALVQLARDGWLCAEPGEGFEPVHERETPEPEDPDVLRRMADEAQQPEPEVDPAPALIAGMSLPEGAAEAVRAAGFPLGTRLTADVAREAMRSTKEQRQTACGHDVTSRCPSCRDSLADYADDDLVYRVGDERPYCSGECVIAEHRAALKQQPTLCSDHDATEPGPADA